MLRSLYSGVSGLKSNQVKMDVIGNNVANSSTTAFKSGRVGFTDLFSQTLSSAQGATATAVGGVNAKQVGLGVSVGTIDTIMTIGSTQTTGRDLDFAIDGDGFFIVTPDNPTIAGDGSKLYTRDGVFYTDSAGNLVNGSGYRVLGTQPPAINIAVSTPDTDATAYIATLDPDDVPTPTSLNLIDLNIPASIDGYELEDFSIDGTGLISAVYNGTTVYLGRVALAKFNNPEGLEKTGGNTYTATGNSGTVQVGIAGSGSYGGIKQGFLEMSNVDLATELTDMIISSRAYQANSKTITTSDEMLQHLLNM